MRGNWIDFFHFLKNFVKTHCVENCRGINNLISIFEKQIYNGWNNKFWTLRWNFGQVWRIHENDWGDFIPLWNWHPMCRMLEFASKVIYWGFLTTVRVRGIRDLYSFGQHVLVPIFLYFNLNRKPIYTNNLAKCLCMVSIQKILFGKK